MQKLTQSSSGMVLIRLVSDLHQEFLDKPFEIIPINKTFKCQVTLCVLAGDIGYPDEKLRRFLRTTRKKFDFVLYVPGNHEFYSKVGDTMADVEIQLERISEECDVIYLNKEEWLLNLPDGDVLRFIGCTLWSKIAPRPNSGYTCEECQYMVETTMNDFAHIWDLPQKLITVEEYNKFHAEDKHWLTRNIPSRYPTIVITHHLPSMDLIHPHYKNHPLTVSGCFSSSCEHILAPNVVGWLCGHSHLGYQEIISKFQVPCWLNPSGYPEENPTNFNPTLTLSYL